jgi:hypothetical protein
VVATTLAFFSPLILFLSQLSNGGLNVKIFLLSILFATLTGGIADAAGQRYNYSGCANNNSQACRNARSAFAEHHSGQLPEAFYNQSYQGQQGRWNQQGSDWRWEGANGSDYRKGHNGWQWSGAQQKHEQHRE